MRAKQPVNQFTLHLLITESDISIQRERRTRFAFSFLFVSYTFIITIVISILLFFVREVARLHVAYV